MPQFPINIQTFPLSSGATDLTYWRSDFIGGSWTTPVLIFDLGATPTFFYNQTAGATSDGTNIGVCIAHSVSPPDATTLESVGDGPPDPVYDASNGNSVTAPSQAQSTGEWLYKGNWYEVVTDLGAPNVRVRKSTDNRATWTELDPTHAPSGTVADPIFFTIVTRNSAVRRSLAVPNKIDLFGTNFGGGDSAIFLYTFDLDTGLWTGPYGVLVISGVQIGNGYNADENFWRFSDGVVRFPNGDLAGFYADNATGQVYCRVFDGTSWGSAIPVGDTTDRYFQAIVDPASPETMYVWTSAVLGSRFRYYSATHTGTVLGPLFTVTTTGSFGGIGHGVCMSGILWVPITDSDDTFNSVWTGAAGGSLIKSPLPVPTPDIGFPPNAGSYMIDWLVSGPTPPPSAAGIIPKFIKPRDWTGR